MTPHPATADVPQELVDAALNGPATRQWRAWVREGHMGLVVRAILSDTLPIAVRRMTPLALVELGRLFALRDLHHAVTEQGLLICDHCSPIATGHIRLLYIAYPCETRRHLDAALPTTGRDLW